MAYVMMVGGAVVFFVAGLFWVAIHTTRPRRYGDDPPWRNEPRRYW